MREMTGTIERVVRNFVSRIVALRRLQGEAFSHHLVAVNGYHAIDDERGMRDQMRGMSPENSEDAETEKCSVMTYGK